MGVLLAFAPFIVFAVVGHLDSGTAGLVAGGAVSTAVVGRDWFNGGRTPKVLELGTVILFAGLALYAVFSDPGWSIIGVRLRVDAGLLLIVLLSIAIRRPFSLQYAREQAAPEIWNHPIFIRTNYVITAVWAVAFAVNVGADLALLYGPAASAGLGVAATILAIIAAFWFTSWYPKHVRANARIDAN